MKVISCTLFSFFLCFIYINEAYSAAALSVTNNRSLNFGKAVKPSSGTSKIVVKRNGSLGGGTNAIMLDTSSISSGRDRIRGSGRDRIQISFSNCSSNSALGLQIKRFTARYGGKNFINTGTNLRPPRRRGRNVTYGANLIINSSAATGTLTPCYNIEVNYD